MTRVIHLVNPNAKETHMQVGELRATMLVRPAKAEAFAGTIEVTV